MSFSCLYYKIFIYDPKTCNFKKSLLEWVIWASGFTLKWKEINFTLLYCWHFVTPLSYLISILNKDVACKAHSSWNHEVNVLKNNHKLLKSSNFMQFFVLIKLIYITLFTYSKVLGYNAFLCIALGKICE